MRVAGLVLAAGSGSRLGRPKAEVVVGGHRLLDVAIDACVRAGLEPVVVVMGAVWLIPMSLADDAVGVDASEGDLPDIWLVENADWRSGMASSLQAGLAAVQQDSGIDAVVVTLVDTPSVGERHLSRVASAIRDGATAVVATYDGRGRLPVGLARGVWVDVAETVSGDEGARGWLRAHPGLVTEVECADLGPWTDIDTLADLP